MSISKKVFQLSHIVPQFGVELPRGYMKILSDPTCKPQYGWNLIRWILRKPLYWKVTYHFEMGAVK